MKKRVKKPWCEACGKSLDAENVSEYDSDYCDNCYQDDGGPDVEFCDKDIFEL